MRPRGATIWQLETMSVIFSLSVLRLSTALPLGYYDHGSCSICSSTAASLVFASYSTAIDYYRLGCPTAHFCSISQAGRKGRSRCVSEAISPRSIGADFLSYSQLGISLPRASWNRPQLKVRRSTRTLARLWQLHCIMFVLAEGSRYRRPLTQIAFAGLPRYIQQYSVVKDELTLYIPPQSVVPVLMFLRDHTQTQFKQCMDICGADYPTRSQRFEVVYHLLSIRFNARIRVKVRFLSIRFRQ